MPDAFDHCAVLVREADRDRYLATLFAPANRRGALFALYAFNSEIARVREQIRQPMAGEIRLQWWRDALGQPGSDDVRSNLVAAALLDAVVRFRIPAASLMAIITAREFDLYDDPMPTLGALEAYGEKTSSALIDMAATILGTGSADLSPAIRHGGIAYGLAGLLRAFPLHASRGQLYVPLEILERHGARPGDVLAGRATAEIGAVLTEMRALARHHFDAYVAAARAVTPQVAPAFLPVSLVPLYLTRLEASRHEPFRLIDVPAWRRQWTMWRAARRM